MFGLLVLIRVDDVFIVFVELVVGFIDLRSKPMISADSLSDSLIFFRTLFVKDDEDKIETRKQRVRHSDIFGWGELGLILSVDRIGCSNN